MAATTEGFRLGYLGRQVANGLSRLPNWGVLLFLGGVAVGMTLQSARLNNLFTDVSLPEWWSSWYQNFSTEMFGAFLTFVLLEMIVATRDRKGQLIMAMGSADNATARNAIDELYSKGWLRDGSLKGARLWRANLQEAYLVRADLQGAWLFRANLQGANLERANLRGADLTGADLTEAVLQGTNLTDVKYDDSTTLPDGTTWASGTDMARFTDPDHPEFYEVS